MIIISCKKTVKFKLWNTYFLKITNFFNLIGSPCKEVSTISYLISNIKTIIIILFAEFLPHITILFNSNIIKRI